MKGENDWLEIDSLEKLTNKELKYKVEQLCRKANRRVAKLIEKASSSKISLKFS